MHAFVHTREYTYFKVLYIRTYVHDSNVLQGLLESSHRAVHTRLTFTGQDARIQKGGGRLRSVPKTLAKFCSECQHFLVAYVCTIFFFFTSGTVYNVIAENWKIHVSGKAFNKLFVKNNVETWLITEIFFFYLKFWRFAKKNLFSLQKLQVMFLVVLGCTIEISAIWTDIYHDLRYLIFYAFRKVENFQLDWELKFQEWFLPRAYVVR